MAYNEKKHLLFTSAWLLSGPVGTFLSGLANNAADALSEKMFGKKETVQAEEKKQPASTAIQILFRLRTSQKKARRRITDIY